MLSGCVKLVDRTGKYLWKAGGLPSTYSLRSAMGTSQSSVKQRLITNFIPRFPLQLSPAKIAPSPLVEHYFYPVSTGPIIKTTKGKIKER
jgi:hypothetical protein